MKQKRSGKLVVGAKVQLLEETYCPRYTISVGDFFIVDEILPMHSNSFIKVCTLEGEYINWYFPSKRFKVLRNATTQLSLPLRFVSES